MDTADFPLLGDGGRPQERIQVVALLENPFSHAGSVHFVPSGRASKSLYILRYIDTIAASRSNAASG